MFGCVTQVGYTSSQGAKRLNVRLTGSLSIGTDNIIYSSSSHFAWAVFVLQLELTVK